MKILFARIGYMTYYAGSQEGDEKPIGGGKYNSDKTGHELYNFKDVGGRLHGYFQPYEKDESHIVTVNLERIDPKCNDNQLDDVMVVFFSKKPNEVGQKVLGWYEHATVHRCFQKPLKQYLREKYYYNLEAYTKHAVLLPTQKRVVEIPKGKGKPGQANAFYLYDTDGTGKDLRHPDNGWINNILNFIRSYKSNNLLDEPEVEGEDELIQNLEKKYAESKGQGICVDVHTRRAVENYSMQKAMKHFSKDYHVEDVSRTRSYDLHCTSKINELEQVFVEVKGTQTAGESVFLTKNEVKLAREHNSKMALYIHHSINISGKGKNCTASGGEKLVFMPWNIDSGRLEPMAYCYHL